MISKVLGNEIAQQRDLMRKRFFNKKSCKLAICPSSLEKYNEILPQDCKAIVYGDLVKKLGKKFTITMLWRDCKTVIYDTSFFGVLAKIMLKSRSQKQESASLKGEFPIIGCTRPCFLFTNLIHI